MAYNSLKEVMHNNITGKRMIGSASIFFAVFFLCMNGVLVIDFLLTGKLHQPGGNLWLYIYVLFFFCSILLAYIKTRMPEKKIPDEELRD
jgi:hypothetical protein